MSAAITGIFSITEPAIYGVNLKYKKPFYIAVVAGGIAGGIAGAGGNFHQGSGLGLDRGAFVTQGGNFSFTGAAGFCGG